MPSFKATDAEASKPAWLTAAQQTDCHGADAAETGTSGLVMHQGWTIPAGGNANPLAQRETIACVNMTSDIGAADDGIWAGTGGGGSPAFTKMVWNDAPAGYSTDTWGNDQSTQEGQNPDDTTYGCVTPYGASGPHIILNPHTRTGSGFLAQQQYSGGDWYVGGMAGSGSNFQNNIWRIFEFNENYRYCDPTNPMPYDLRLYPETLSYGQSITYPAGITLDLPLQMERWYTGQEEQEVGAGHYSSAWYFTLREADMDFTQPAWVLHPLNPNEVSRWTTILAEWSTSALMGKAWEWSIDASSIIDGSAPYWYQGP